MTQHFCRRTLEVCAIILFATCLTMSAPGQVLDVSGRNVSTTAQREDEPALPYKVSSRIHLQAGGTTGYLVVKVELEKGKYLYSLTQAGDISPTKLKVEPNKYFSLTGKFQSDKPPKVIAKDPLFGHKVEKHFDTVQFFVPIRVTADAVAEQLLASVELKGQVCSENSCLLLNKKVSGAFAGYFERTAGRDNDIQRSSKK